mgnify:CR=1 FL=1
MKHKILIEVDVAPESDQKTEKLKKITEALENLDCVENVSMVSYIENGEKKRYEIDLQE